MFLANPRTFQCHRAAPAPLLCHAGMSKVEEHSAGSQAESPPQEDASPAVAAENVAMTEANKLAPFNPTCDECITAAFEMSALSAKDTLLDVGCGDGRLLVQASCFSWQWGPPAVP